MTALRTTFHLFVRDCALALARFTRLRPRPPDAGAAPAATGAASLAQAPGVGWLVGMVACLVFALVSVMLRGNPWSPAVAAVFSTLATVLLTGALHEGALFRTADRLDAAQPGASGSALGVIASLLLIAGKLALLAALAAASEVALMSALFAAHVVSRYLPLAAAHLLSPAAVQRRALGLSALWCVVPLSLMVLVAGPAFPAIALLAAVLAGLAMLHFLRRRAAGFDDGVFGAVQQVCEAGFYLGAALAAG
ncbi:adenosylcobinamide-GDP ribazoletransferase [Ramlibacter sp. PS3R-8]|uniref:adenosylcobinamide-GDP ribazoletransferase n=1 Tax=Ramlibacter sp. PS3R-8 TaxID=3133437 RepID=UPI0030997AE0